MRIEPNKPPVGLDQAAARKAEVKPEPLSDKADLEASEALDARLESTPDLRADQVARAKALVADPNYPPANVVRQVADKIAAGAKNPADR